MSQRRAPIEAPLADKAHDFCDGPDFLAVTQTLPYSKRWVTWVASGGMRWAIHQPGMQFSDTEGSANTLFTGGERPAHVSMAFDQDAKPALAIPLNPTTVRVRKFVGGVVTTFDFAGESPILFYTGNIVWPTANSDIICLYIKSPYDKLYARVQRDNFGTEYVVNATLAPGTSIKRLIKADDFKENGYTRQYLYGVTPQGEPIEWRSKIYPPFPAFGQDNAKMNLGFKDGALVAVTILLNMGFEKSNVTLALKDGNYQAVIIDRNLGNEKAVMSLAVKDGTYTMVIISKDVGFDKGLMTLAFKEGAYTNTVQSAGTFTEKANCTLSFKDGVYAT